MKKDKKWLRDELMKFRESTPERYDDVIGVSHVLRVIDQLDEPEKADWIENKQLLNDGDLKVELFNGRYRVTKLLSGTPGIDGRYQVITFTKHDMMRLTACKKENEKWE